MPPQRNILIFHLGALGDFVLTWPLALAMGRLYPQSRVFYVTHAQKGQLAEKALRVESADIEGGWHGLFADKATLTPGATKLLSSSHTVISFLTDGQDAWARNVKRIAPGVTLVPLRGSGSLSQYSGGGLGWGKLEIRDLRFEEPLPRPSPGVPGGGEKHAAEVMVDQLQSWPAIQTAARQMLRSIADRGVGGRGVVDGGVVIHPGSGSPGKCWPLERFVQLAGQFVEAGRQVRFVIGETELERWPKTAIEQMQSVAPVETPTDLVALWKLLNSAELFVGNDSGPGHLAGVIGVPAIALFSATNPSIWKPLGPKVSVIGRETLESITVDEVRGIAKWHRPSGRCVSGGNTGRKPGATQTTE